MIFFDMTPKKACHVFDIKLAFLRELVTYGSGIGHCRYDGELTAITSLDLEAALARLREQAQDEESLQGG